MECGIQHKSVVVPFLGNLFVFQWVFRLVVGEKSNKVKVNFRKKYLSIVNVLFANDVSGLMGVVFLMVIIYTTVNLIVDLLYDVLYPRVRYY